MTQKPNAFFRIFGLCLMVACLSFTAACGDSTDDGGSGSTTGGETTGGTGTSATTGGDTTGGTTGGDTTGGTTGGDTTGGTTGGDPFEECRNTCTTLVGECEAEFLAADCTEDDLDTLETNCLAACEDEANHGQIAAAGSIACADVVGLAVSSLGGEGVCEPDDLCAEVTCEEGETCNPETGECEGEANLCAEVTCEEGEICNPETGACEVFECEADAYEENNSFDTATAIDADVDWSASICGDDIDFYALTVPAGQQAFVQVLFTHDNGDLDVGIYSGEQEELGSSASADDDELLILQGGEDGASYFFNVFGYQGAENNYGLVVDIQDPGTNCVADGNCEEGQICTSDNTCLDVECAVNEDCAEGQICTDDNTCLDVDCITDADCGDLEICDDTNSCLAVECVTFEDCDSTDFCNVENTCETIVCASDADCRPDFPICDTGTGECGACDNPDAFEPNDDGENASVLSEVGDATLNACGSPDYFSFSATALTRVTIDVLFSQAEGDIDAAIYDATQPDPLQDPEGFFLAGGTTDTDNEQIVYDVTEDQELMLVVLGYLNASNDYTIEISTEDVECFSADNCEGDDVCRADNTCGGCLENADCGDGEFCDVETGACNACADDQFEPNNTAEEAADLPVAATAYELSICTDDVDFYAFTLAAGESARIFLSFTHADGDIDAILTANGEDFGGAFSSDDNETLIIPAVDAETNFVLEVSGFLGSTNVYTLEFTPNPEGLCTEDTDCAEGEFCIDNACAAVDCAADSDCGDLQICNDANECVDVECVTTGDCDGSDFCNAENVCETIVCETNLDCRVDFPICDVDTNTCGACDNPDAFEPNDDPENASVLSEVGDATLNVCGGPDYFSFSAASGQIVTIDVLFSNEEGDIDAYLVDAADPTVALAQGISTDDNEQLVYELDADQELMLLVLGYGDAINDYTLTVDIQ